MRINESWLLYRISYMYTFTTLITPTIIGDVGLPVTAISRKESLHYRRNVAGPVAYMADFLLFPVHM